MIAGIPHLLACLVHRNDPCLPPVLYYELHIQKKRRNRARQYSTQPATNGSNVIHGDVCFLRGIQQAQLRQERTPKHSLAYSQLAGVLNWGGTASPETFLIRVKRERMGVPQPSHASLPSLCRWRSCRRTSSSCLIRRSSTTKAHPARDSVKGSMERTTPPFEIIIPVYEEHGRFPYTAPRIRNNQDTTFGTKPPSPELWITRRRVLHSAKMELHRDLEQMSFIQTLP